MRTPIVTSDKSLPGVHKLANVTQIHPLSHPTRFASASHALLSSYQTNSSKLSQRIPEYRSKMTTVATSKFDPNNAQNLVEVCIHLNQCNGMEVYG